jgi:hypothetical protein
MRNSSVGELDALVGESNLTLTMAWFLDSLDVCQYGHATGRWLGEALVELEAEPDGEMVWHFVFGRK